MTHNTVKEWLRKQPFVPFTLIMSNGDRYEVRHPENAALLKTNLVVGGPDSDEWSELALSHVASIDRLESSEAAAG